MFGLDEIPLRRPFVRYHLERRTAAHQAAYTKKDALVSVIIPVFRGAMPRKRSLGSVLKQSHRNLELLVVGHAADRASADAVAA